MANVAVVAGFNQSKHQMGIAEAANGVALPNILGTDFGLMVKDSTAQFNQLEIKSRYFDVVDYIRDHNVLNEIKAGDHDGNSHLMVSMARNLTVTVQVVPAYAWWALAPVDSISIALPVQSGWVKDGSTVYLGNVSKRVFEVLRESFLVYI